MEYGRNCPNALEKVHFTCIWISQIPKSEVQKRKIRYFFSQLKLWSINTVKHHTEKLIKN